MISRENEQISGFHKLRDEEPFYPDTVFVAGDKDDDDGNDDDNEDIDISKKESPKRKTQQKMPSESIQMLT